MKPLHERFLDVLEASQPDTLVAAVCENEIGVGTDLIDTWKVHHGGFAERFEGLVDGTRRAQLGAEERSRRLEIYLRELELHHIDEKRIDRDKAAKKAGVSLTDVVRAGDESSPDTFDPEFHRREEEILLRQVIVAEDKAANLAGYSKLEADDAGYDWRQMSQLTTYLKSRSKKHQPAERLIVGGRVNHEHHHLLQHFGVFRELQQQRHRFLPPERQEVLIVEAE